MDYLAHCYELLNSNGPLLGSELVESLVSSGIKQGNARQIIKRLKDSGKILSTKPINFGHNQYLYFLVGQSLTEKIKLVSVDKRTSFHRAYQAFEDRKGILTWTEFAKATATVVEGDKSFGHITTEKCLWELKTLGLVDNWVPSQQGRPIFASPSWIPNIDTSQSISKRFAVKKIEDFMTKELMNWLARLNFVGWNSTYYNTPINGLYFDAYAFSYLWGLYTLGEKKTGSLIVVDSILSRIVKSYDIEGLAARAEILYGRLRKNRENGAGINSNYRIIPVVFAKEMEHDALILARTKGILTVTLSEVFGNKMVSILDGLLNINSDTDEESAKSVSEAITTASETGYESMVSALKGYLLNIMILTIFKERTWTVDMGEKRKNEKGEECECDILARISKYIIIGESKVKTLKRKVHLGTDEDDKNSVKRFFQRTKRIVEETELKQVIPIFFTSGYFEDDAKAYMDNRKKLIRLLEEANPMGGFPDQLYYDRDGLLKLFQGKPEFKNILKKHFF